MSDGTQRPLFPVEGVPRSTILRELDEAAALDDPVKGGPASLSLVVNDEFQKLIAHAFQRFLTHNAVFGDSLPAISRMEREVIAMVLEIAGGGPDSAGYMTLGGRGANRNFHGKIASFVSTTLRISDSMPSTAEIEAMITDPVSWVDDYKAGNNYRVANGTQNFSNFQRVTSHGNGTYLAGATQVWLMGDGTNDSYSNMIRNYIQPQDQNNTKLNLISMQSNDIQNVTIQGLFN